MKYFRTARVFVLVALMFAAGCSGLTGGTETGTTNTIDTASVASRLEDAASTLVLSIPESAETSLSALTYGTEAMWDSYINTDQTDFLPDIFGPAPGVITRVRVLVKLMAQEIAQTFETDTDIDCEGSEVLDAGDLLPVAFFGDLPNGSAADRAFDCVKTADDDPSRIKTIVYGKDAQEVLHIAFMTDYTTPNTTETATYGDTVQVISSSYAHYAERTEDGRTVGYLDMDFAHGSASNGPDLTFGSGDEVVFKSRSRLVGRVLLNASGNVEDGWGEFAVSRYDREGSGTPMVTKTVGRGSFETGDHSLFHVDSTTFPDEVGIYCLESSEEALPSNADPALCSGLEGAPAWGDTAFPFTLTPAIPAAFEDHAFFEANDTDMISDSGDNFEIPEYATVE